MGEAKRRKELGLPPREKQVELPKFDKESLQKKVRSTLYENPIIPILFYSVAIGAIIWAVFNLLKLYKFF